MTTIATNPFARRHTAGSGLSYYNGSWADLEALVRARLDAAAAGKVGRDDDAIAAVKPGYRPGVALVVVPAEGFVSGVVALDPETPVTAACKPRRDGEDAVLDVRASADPLPARYVEVVVYSHAVLVEGDEASSDADWEIVSINASPVDGPTPMHPIAMARNQLGHTGGSHASYTSEEWAESVWFWATHAMAQEG